MRIMLALLVLPCLVLADDDAEKRVRTMEKKIADAKSLQVTFDISAEGLRESGFKDVKHGGRQPRYIGRQHQDGANSWVANGLRRH